MHRFDMRLLLYPALAIPVTPLLAQTAAPVAKAAATITAADVARHVGVIADDSMRGRDTPSRGLELTAQYVADQFKAFGLKPGGDNGTWFQRYWVLNDTVNSRVLQFLDPNFSMPKDTVTVPNTLGVLEGSDPQLKHEYIVVSGHMDHIGINMNPDSGQTDIVNNGAYDNSSGTAGVIELAKAFSQAGVRPRRSVIFLTVSGEEKGFLGSDYFVTHPVVPIGQIVANINLDGIGRDWEDTVLVVGKKYSDLGTTLDRVNAAHPELHMTLIAEERFFMASDQYSFARRGIPSLFFFTGETPYLHTVADSPDKIDAEKETRILRLAFYFGLEVANADQRPTWDPASYQKIVEP